MKSMKSMKMDDIIQKLYIGMDIHEDYITGTAMGKDGVIEFSGNFRNTKEAAQCFLSGIPSPQVIIAVEACGLWRGVYNMLTVYQKIHDFFFNWSWGDKNWLKPLFGMVAAAVVVIPFYPNLMKLHVVSGGHAAIDILMGTPADHVLDAVILMIIATSLISGTGGSGGLFMPVMMVGAFLGAIGGS